VQPCFIPSINAAAKKKTVRLKLLNSAQDCCSGVVGLRAIVAVMQKPREAAATNSISSPGLLRETMKSHVYRQIALMLKNSVNHNEYKRGESVKEVPKAEKAAKPIVYQQSASRRNAV
jgi:hypothetical protein